MNKEEIWGFRKLGTLLVFFLNIVLIGLSTEYNLPYLLVVIPIEIVAVAFYQFKRFNNRKPDNIISTIKNLETDDLYGEFIQFKQGLLMPQTSDHAPQNYYTYNKEDLDILEELIIILSKHPNLLYPKIDKFEKYNKTSSQFYRRAYIYFVHYLLEDNIPMFVYNYKEFQKDLGLRTEKRVLNMNLNEYKFLDKSIVFNKELIRLMYEYYELGLSIDDEILRINPKTKLDQMIYVIILYNYLKATENHKLIADIESEYQDLKNLRDII